jgi:hypothetical protein
MMLAPSLAFAGRSTLSIQEIANRLACTVQHLLNLVESGCIVRQRARMRVALATKRLAAEDYRRFLAGRCTARKPDFAPATVPWASLEFDGPVAVTVDQIGQKFQYTGTHISRHIEEGGLVAYDIRGKDSARRFYRVPVESYRRWVASLVIKPTSV